MAIARVSVAKQTTALAELIRGFELASVPEAALSSAKLALLDTLGASIAGSAPWIGAGRIMSGLVEDQGGRPQSTVIGGSAKTAATLAALANGTLAYACDIEARHVPSISHIYAVVAPAALAIAEREAASGAAFLAAVVIGAEAGTRAALALDPRQLYDRGYHPTSVGGVFGAAAAAGYLLGLDAAKMENALGLAATQASGLLAWASDPTEHSRPLNCGLAARDGVTAALLAAGGFGGPRGVFDPEQKYNVFTAFVAGGAPERLLEGWGEEWAVENVAYKRYACCGFIHPGLDGLFAIVEREQLGPDQIDSIRLRFPAGGVAMIDDNPLRSHCAQYILASAVVRGKVAIADILGDAPPDPRTLALRERVAVVPDSELDRTYPERRVSIMEVLDRSGRKFSERVEFPRGDPSNPLSEVEIRAKYAELAGEVWSLERCTAIEAAVDNVECLTRIDQLSGLLAGPS